MLRRACQPCRVTRRDDMEVTNTVLPVVCYQRVSVFASGSRFDGELMVPVAFGTDDPTRSMRF